MPGPTNAAMKDINASLQRLVDAAREDADRYESAIRWALGEKGDFRLRGESDPPYWWRGELRKRAGLR